MKNLKTKLVLGTVQLGLNYGVNNSIGKPSLKESFEILEYAWSNGIRDLDTANAYGNAVDLIGNYHKNSSNKFNIISKFHGAGSGLNDTIKNELECLSIEQFEAYLFHSFADFENDDGGIINALLNLKEQGFIKKIGVSVYGNDQFQKAIENDNIDIIQFPYNLLDNFSNRGELMHLAKSKGKELHVRSVFLQGLFFMNRNAVPQKIAKLIPYLIQIDELSGNEKLTNYELAMGYVLQNEMIDKVLIGVDSLEQLKTNILAIDKIKKINSSTLNAINKIEVKEKDLLNPVNWK